MTNRVLIINNSPEILRAVCNLLSLEGYHVFEATYDQNLVIELQRIQPQLVILDYVPQFEVRLLELVDQLKTQGSIPIPTIVTTVRFDIPATVKTHLKTQAFEVLIKPFGSGDLLKAVRAKLPTTTGANTCDVG